MSDQERVRLQQIKLSFPYTKGNLPHYSNAVLVNNLGEGTVILDFGFFDPLSMKDSLDLKLIGEVEPVTRVLLTRDTAKQLIDSLTLALKQSASPIVEE